jgi:hypothetical protein
MRRSSLLSLWNRLRTLNPDLADGAVFAAINGELGLNSPTRVRLTVTDRQIMIVPLPGQRASEVLTFTPADISTVSWSSRRSFRSNSADLRFGLHGREPVWLRVSCPGWSSDLAQMRRALHLVSPDSELGPGLRLRVKAPYWPGMAVVALVALLGAISVIQGLGSSSSPTRATASPAVSSPATDPDPVSAVTTEPVPTTEPAPTISPSPRGFVGPPLYPKGYKPLTERDRQPLVLGAPWGRPCAPLHLTLGPGMPPHVDANLARVLTQLDASVPVIVVVTDGASHTVYGPGPGPGVRLNGPVSNALTFVDVPIDRIDDVTLENGVRATSWLAVWSTKPSQIPAQVVIGRMTAGLPHNVDDVTSRRMLRLVLARTMGIFESVRPGSGLLNNSDAAIDGFSAQDISALRAFSGC